MTRRVIVSALSGLALSGLVLGGCGESDKPTVTRVPLAADEPSTESDVPSSPAKMPSGFTMPPEMGKTHPGMGAMSPEAGTPQETLASPAVKLETMELTAPEGWIRKQPRTGMVLAEFTLPHAEGDTEDGRLTVMAIGVTVEQIVSIWKSGFVGTPRNESVEQLDLGTTKATIIDLAGSHSGGSAMMGMSAAGPPTEKRLLGAIFRVDGHQFSIKALGPEKTMAAQAENFTAFLKSLAPSAPEATEQEAEPPTEDAEPKQ